MQKIASHVVTFVALFKFLLKLAHRVRDDIASSTSDLMMLGIITSAFKEYWR